jgi:hypothetical protein
MRVRSVVFVFVACALSVVLVLSGVVVAQQAPAKPAAPAQGAAMQTPQLHGTLLQVMRGILFVNSNIIFTAQAEDPATLKRDEFEATSPRAMTGLYGGWESVENASVALAEAANLLIIPGRRCSNGRLAPIDNPDWVKYVQILRDSGMAALKAARSKNQDAIVEVSETVTQACANCHERWRDVEPITNRCR